MSQHSRFRGYFAGDASLTVASILSALRFSLAVLVRLVLLTGAGAALAAPAVNLAPGLEITLPTSLAINVLEAQYNKNPVIAGEISGEPGYFIAATKVRTWERNNILWRKLETEIRSRSANDFAIVMRGSFATAASDAVWYRAYEYESLDQQHRQVYFLIKGERSIYWITLTTVAEVNIDLVLPIAKALIQRARLVDE